jgi:hypothetical protein
MTTVKIAQCPLCKGTVTVNRFMICARCDGGEILDEKVLAAEHRGRLQTRSTHSTVSNRLSGQDDSLSDYPEFQKQCEARIPKLRRKYLHRFKTVLLAAQELSLTILRFKHSVGSERDFLSSFRSSELSQSL